MSTTQNMGLTVPDVSVTTGPQWAQQINSDLSIIDSHNHAPGSGVQIPTAGININDDLSFNQSWSALDVKSVGFTSQASAISTALINRLYVVNGNLYYNDNAGNQIPITVSGGVAGSPGNITGLVAPASASYSPGTTTFSWQSNSNVPALMDCGPVLVRPPTVNSFGVSLESPTGLGVNQSLTLPARPASQSLITMSNGGVQTTATVNSTLTLTTSSLTVANNGITATQLASNAVTTTKIASAAVDKTKLSAVGELISASCGTQIITSSSFSPVTNLTCTLNTTVNRPVIAFLQGASTSSASFLSVTSLGAEFCVEVQYPGGGTVNVGRVRVTGNTGGNVYHSPSSVYVMFLPSSYGNTGTFVFTVLARSINSGDSTTLNNCQLVVYQL